MIDRRIVKLKLRRGTDDQRRTVVFEEGELIYTTDTKRVYVGDGRLSGGNLLANSVYGLTGFPAVATSNDLLYRYDFGKTYIYGDDGSWTFIGPYPDESTLTFEGTKLAVRASGIENTHLNATVVDANGGLNLGSSGLTVKYDTNTLTVDAGYLKVLPGAGTVVLSPDGGIINTLYGLEINADDTTLEVLNAGLGNVLKVKQIAAAQIASNAVEITKLNSNVVKPNGALSITVNGIAVDYDPTTLSVVGNKLTVNSVGVLPAGTIIATAALTAAPGFLVADGSVVSRAAYPALFGAIGVNYNTGTVGATEFKLPDLRGYFIRCAGTNEDSTASGIQGAKQSDSIRRHNHSYTNGSAVRTTPGDQVINVRQFSTNETSYTGFTGETETRPANIPMIHVIKT